MFKMDTTTLQIFLHLTILNHFISAAPINYNTEDAGRPTVELVYKHNTHTHTHTHTLKLQLNYLTRFGYIADSPGAQRSEHSIMVALQQLQQFAHLRPTGVLDAPTRELLARKRCGLPDGQSEQSGQRRKRYALQGSKWEHKNLTYR
jgi:hypothetical protein